VSMETTSGSLDILGANLDSAAVPMTRSGVLDSIRMMPKVRSRNGVTMG
jgi:hypothetical protein